MDFLMGLLFDKKSKFGITIVGCGLLIISFFTGIATAKEINRTKKIGISSVQKEAISDQKPTVSIKKVNTSQVGLYEKFEVQLNLQNVKYYNPYDYKQIDVRAVFISPSGKKWEIYGFYDNFKKADAWKIRFSPNETGTWTYRVSVEDYQGKVYSKVHTFTAVESAHHGWIRTSNDNPHYFQYDDSTSFYGIGVYSPWGNDQQRLDTFSKHHANLLALWNITYGGMVNDHGLIEDSLGHYNQNKLGHLDIFMSELEERDIKLMLAIWPHDLFSATVWAHQWHINPYRDITKVQEVYSDAAAWEFQKKLYRYLIARYGYSRSFGIWEIINEMNGTDGWQDGHHLEAYEWVNKVSVYFRNHDPYHHPTTASFSGGKKEYRETLYHLTDVPNIHLYSKQGWTPEFSQDSMRSSMFNYAWASRRFWNTFYKPSIFGESGASLSYYKPGTRDYEIAYHNAIWASLTNGLASTPVWWSYKDLSSQSWNYLQYLQQFVRDIDFAHLELIPANITVSHADAYGLKTDNFVFGWIRSYDGKGISGKKVEINNLDNGNYRIIWYDTWQGEFIKEIKQKISNHTLSEQIPSISGNVPDVALKVVKVED